MLWWAEWPQTNFQKKPFLLGAYNVELSDNNHFHYYLCLNFKDSSQNVWSHFSRRLAKHMKMNSFYTDTFWKPFYLIQLIPKGKMNQY